MEDAGPGIAIDADLVRALLGSQFPDLADRPITPLTASGTDNALFRLGADLCVRLPRVAWAQATAPREVAILTRLAPIASLPTPRPIGLGAPDCGYPWRFSIVTWLPGRTVETGRLADPLGAAAALADFVAALWRADTRGGPRAGRDSRRGVPLALRDSDVRAAIQDVADLFDPVRVTAVWDRAMAAPVYDGAGRWIHGDLHAGNILVDAEQLSGVIDFGLAAVGDPSVDLMPGWTLFEGGSRTRFFDRLGVDSALLARGRGWTVSVGLIALAYYRTRNPDQARRAGHAIAAVLAE